MKVLRNAQQKNMIVDTGYYTKDQLNKMYEDGVVFTLNDVFKSLNMEESDDEGCSCYRVSLSDAKEIEVIYDRENGCYRPVVYRPVVVMKSGEQIAVEF